MLRRLRTSRDISADADTIYCLLGKQNDIPALCAARYIPLRGMLKTNTRPRIRSGVCLIYPCQTRLNAGNCVLPLFFSDLARWRLLRASSLTLSITDMSDLPGECDAHRPVSQQCWKKTRVPSIPQNCERITFKFPSTYIDNFFQERLHIFGKIFSYFFGIYRQFHILYFLLEILYHFQT